jgi:hypothetical protein
MYRLFATLTVLILPYGCAVDPVRTPAFAANGSAAPTASLVSETPIKAVDIGGYDQVNCQNFRRPGSRVLTSKRCYTVDRSLPESANQQQIDQEKSEQLDEIRRLQMWREEVELERQRRTLYGREAFP